MIFCNPNITFFAVLSVLGCKKGAKGAFRGAEKNPLKAFCRAKGAKGAKKYYTPM